MTPTSPVGTVQNDAPEPFPSLEEDPPSPTSPSRATTEHHNHTRNRDQSTTSTFQERLRSASKGFSESSPPTGMWIATGQIAASVPSLTDIRRGSYGSEGWSGEGQIREKERRRSTLSRRGSSQTGEELTRRKSSINPNSPRETTSNPDIIPETVPEVSAESEKTGLGVITSGVPLGASEATNSMSNPAVTEKRIERRSSSDTNITPTQTGKTAADFRTEPFENGYQFPPKHKWTESTATGLKAFWKFFLTPLGFLVTIYGLNVVAWGGMLFLLLCNASPAMCKPTCNDINSPRRKWIEVDSQILNALFCVTGFGLIPWRFRDLYYLLQYRVMKNELGLRRLAGINRGWFRLAGSQDLPIELGPAEVEAGAEVPESSIPFPISRTPNAPLTGIRAPPTKMWKLDFVIWTMVWNTFLQAVLSGFMWGLNRYNRPSWSTGLFVAMACIVAACGGIMAFIEGKHVKAIEGVPVSEKDQERLKRDRELGITHYNNIKDEGPKEKKTSEQKGLFKRKQKTEAVAVDEGALERA
ncbi:uncharacterized protein LY89DRAFT_704949 [Mollisia scopiformis]|uniref:Uncharacterized protein n=1 Tax=Mollisia scopiformis TaxID=149040 RepID=A0A194XLI0_MOLSC|nr:uncharacterized protein LY89DRAFT_704949 [Mollisia scopiformis]KUJ20991.1 hypothetical protein LY89DRAFT_704949 [Mollisia scopiformis]